ncbi:MAG TPA: chorismate-binding protein [Ramlibacter sp.]|nr:chorismate-binding protein [Ramlibacter sp.]
MTNEAFALLDDAGASGASRLLTQFVREHRCDDPRALDATCAAVQADLAQGLHAVLLADYEWGLRLMGLDVGMAAGALRVLMFRRCERLSGEAVDFWLARADAPLDATAPAGFFGWTPSVNAQQFDEAIGRIRSLIAAGETYQINYTYRLQGWALGEPRALYRLLRQRQSVPYGALIGLPRADGALGAEAGIDHVLSLSPELFLRFDAGRLLAKPMKGTAPCPADDVQAAADALAADPKNRAENVMIVDLLRNDLGRIAVPGTVQTPRLFEVERHGEVLQMTSTVQAVPAPGTTLADVLRAAFPCGSITGAPKRRSAEWISQLESTPRGLYTGAIGWLEAAPAGEALGPFCLSVAIRTLTLGPVEDGLRSARLGVGAGIVWDSVAAMEHAECELKSAFVTGMPAGFGLLETMRVEDGRIALWDRHIARLRSSAGELGFAFDEQWVRAQVDHLRETLGAGTWRIRLCLQSDGRADLSSEALAPLPADGHRLLLAPLAPGVSLRLARFKTTLRQHYDAGVRQAVAAGAFDTLFHTADGRLVEGGRSNVLLRLDGRWVTPPVQDGALPGVMRSALLASKALGVSEGSLHVSDLARASAVVVCNALRGILPITFVGDTEFSGHR